MQFKMYHRNFAFTAAMLTLSPVAWGQQQGAVDPVYYQNAIARAQNVSSLGPDLFGDQTDLVDGRTTFYVVDVELQTNSSLPMRIARTFDPVRKEEKSIGTHAVFSDWGMDSPYITGVYGAGTDWTIAGLNTSYAYERCTKIEPEMINGVGAFNYYTYQSDTFWRGVFMNIPGQGLQPVLKAGAGQKLTNGESILYTTRSNWQISCLSTIKNGPGQGFKVTLPNGTKYYFDWLARSDTRHLYDARCFRQDMANTACSTGVAVPLSNYFLFATKAEDRFGNWIAYDYENDADKHAKLKKMTSSDGQTIVINYNSGTYQPLVTSITANNRTWTYGFNSAPASMLSLGLTSVTQPDGKQWTYSGELVYTDSVQDWNHCNPRIGTHKSEFTPESGEMKTLVMKHPSGATGEFTIRSLWQGTQRSPGGCELITEDGFGGARIWTQFSGALKAYMTVSLVEKKISGSGVATQSWKYFYQPQWSWKSSYPPNDECPAADSCLEPSITTVTNPDGSSVKYTYEAVWEKAGQLRDAQFFAPNGTLVKKDTATYIQQPPFGDTHAPPNGQPYPESFGGPLLTYRQNPMAWRLVPVATSATTVDGVTFTTQNITFDKFARPISIKRSNSLGYSRTEAVAYDDDLNKWVLGQVKSVTCTAPANCANKVISKTDYDPTTRLPIRTYQFGNLLSSYTYNANGTVASVSDARDTSTFDTTVKYSDWKSGVPQTVTFPITPDQATAVTKKAIVNGNGWIESVTDENGPGFITKYGYDTMGRINVIDYPDGDTVAWATSTYEFAPNPDATYGLPAGYWRKVERTGNARRITHYDALWRPAVEEIADAADPDNTRVLVVKRYDTQNRLVFQSYPVRSLTSFTDVSLKGVTTSYDALSRPTTIKQDSELGVLTTTTKYLSGFKTEVTNPRGQKITSSYMTWDQPTTEFPVEIDQPEGVHTSIKRDAFGKALEVTRSGPDQ